MYSFGKHILHADMVKVKQLGKVMGDDAFATELQSFVKLEQKVDAVALQHTILIECQSAMKAAQQKAKDTMRKKLRKSGSAQQVTEH